MAQEEEVPEAEDIHTYTNTFPQHLSHAHAHVHVHVHVCVVPVTYVSVYLTRADGLHSKVLHKVECDHL